MLHLLKPIDLRKHIMSSTFGRVNRSQVCCKRHRDHESMFNSSASHSKRIETGGDEEPPLNIAHKPRIDKQMLYQNYKVNHFKKQQTLNGKNAVIMKRSSIEQSVRDESSNDSLYNVSEKSIKIQTRGTCPGMDNKKLEVFYDTPKGDNPESQP